MGYVSPLEGPPAPRNRTLSSCLVHFPLYEFPDPTPVLFHLPPPQVGLLIPVIRLVVVTFFGKLLRSRPHLHRIPDSCIHLHLPPVLALSGPAGFVSFLQLHRPLL